MLSRLYIYCILLVLMTTESALKYSLAILRFIQNAYIASMWGNLDVQ